MDVSIYNLKLKKSPTLFFPWEEAVGTFERKLSFYQRDFDYTRVMCYTFNQNILSGIVVDPYNSSTLGGY